MSYTINGWLSQVQEAMVPFHHIHSELNVEHGCLLWCCRVIIPVQFHSQLLQELHTSHSGVSRMKSVALSIFWWPGLDNDVVQLASDCGICQQIANRLAKEEVHHWAYPAAPFERVQLDLAEYEDQFFLVLVDDFSKWLDVFELGSSTTATRTLQHLLRFIANC